MAENQRIEVLRQRVEHDPGSVAFAQLAEEYRRAGELEEAVRICRAGLVVHPGYLSARVTLGRALAELGRIDEATAEFERVLATAPDNLVALRSMAELHGQHDAAPSHSEPAADAAFDRVVAEFHEALAEPESSPELRELETWLAAILADRADRERRL